LSNPDFFDETYTRASTTTESQERESPGKRLRAVVAAGAEPQAGLYEQAKPRREVFTATLPKA